MQNYAIQQNRTLIKRIFSTGTIHHLLDKHEIVFVNSEPKKLYNINYHKLALRLIFLLVILRASY
jgi:hypothetical protein